MLLVGRSSFTPNYNLIFNMGVIDPDYTEEIKISVYNPNNHPIAIPRFKAIGQLIVLPYKSPRIINVNTPPTPTLHKGFGSTDKQQKANIQKGNIKQNSNTEANASQHDTENNTVQIDNENTKEDEENENEDHENTQNNVESE